MERRWSEYADKAVVLSRRDWGRVSGWHAVGIPLDVVWEVMQSAFRPGCRRNPPRGPGDLDPAVREAWSVVVQGRLVHEPQRPPTVVTDPVGAWRRRAAVEPSDSSLGRLLGALLDRLERGEEPAPLDAELDRRLADLVPEPMKTQVHDDLEGELEAFRSRMSPERFEATRRRASARRLRRLLDLPRLAEPESSD